MIISSFSRDSSLDDIFDRRATTIITFHFGNGGNDKSGRNERARKTDCKHGGLKSPSFDRCCLDLSRSSAAIQRSGDKWAAISREFKRSSNRFWESRGNPGTDIIVYNKYSVRIVED